MRLEDITALPLFLQLFILVGHVIGGVAFLAVARLIHAQHERPTCERLA
jgi:hypothetical protein